MDPRLHERLAAKVEETFGPGAEIAGIERLAGDASTRSYHRIALDPFRRPPSLIVMQWSDPGLAISSDELAVFDRPPDELPFLNVHRFLSEIGVRVPRVYAHWHNEGILFLEDLGDVCLWDKVQGLPEDQVLAWYSKAIDELLKLQVAGTRARDPSCIAFQQSFDRRLYLWEFEHFLEYGLRGGGLRALPSGIEQRLVDAFGIITERLTHVPQVLNHRDYHSWNLMICKDEIAVIDFQDALLAPPSYDLASLLNDRETDRVITAALEKRLVESYLKKRHLLGEPVLQSEEFWETYLLSVLQRDLKVVGRFVYLDLVKGKPGYRRFLGPTIGRISRTLARVPRLGDIAPVLRSRLAELR